MTFVPTQIQSLLDLFQSDLSHVHFADVDAQTLSRLAAEVQTTAEAVATARAALDVAERALQERQEALMQQSQRALAYARVYAESNDVLRERLDAIVLPRVARRPRSEPAATPIAEPAPRRRGRPRKSEATGQVEMAAAE